MGSESGLEEGGEFTQLVLMDVERDSIASNEESHNTDAAESVLYQALCIRWKDFPRCPLTCALARSGSPYLMKDLLGFDARWDIHTMKLGQPM